MPQSSLWGPLDVWLRHLLPVGSIVFLIILLAIPLPMGVDVAPMLPMVAVYYWAIYRPDLLPSWVVFLLGVLFDALYGTPLGVNTLIFLLVYGVAASQRRFFIGKSFLVSWWAFCLLAAAVSLLSWLIIVAINRHILPFWPLVIQYILTVGLFPLLVWTLAQLQVRILKEED